MRRSLAICLIFLAVGGLEAAAQTISPRAATLTIGGRLHSQFHASSETAADNDFFIRRGRVNVDMGFNDFLSGRLLTDFAGGTAMIQDAYVRMTFDSGLRVYMGQFKRAFDLFELSSSTDLTVIERDGRVAGYDMCTGVGSVCSYSRLMQELAYSERDAGVKVDGSSGAMSYQLTLTNGTGINARDENDGKSFSGRASFDVGDGVTVSGNIGSHDYVDPTTSTARAWAWGGDVQVGDWRDGFMLQGALASGDNWMSLDAGNNPGTFITLQAIASYYNPMEGDNFQAIEPLLRVSWADPDGDVADDGGTLITPGVMLYLMDGTKNRIGVNFDYYMPQVGDAVYSFKVQSFLYF